MGKDKNSSKSGYPIWFCVLLAALIVGIGIPLIKLLGKAVSEVVSILLLAVIALLLYKALKKKENNTEQITDIETCSDIRSLDVKLGAGMFVIEQGEGFKIDDGSLQSSISGGTWYILGNITDNISEKEPKITVITVPRSFTAEKADIQLGAGSLLIKGLSAYEMSLEVAMGSMEAAKLYAKRLNIQCGVGRMKAEAGMHGDVGISCGMGETELRLTNRTEEFNCTVSSGLGKVYVDGLELTGGGQPFSDSSAPYGMDIKCGMGSVMVDFGGVL